MITKETIQKYVFNKPKVNEFLSGLMIIVAVFFTMFFSVTFLENELLFIGFIASGILIGLSLSLTKNIFFPIGIIIIYNLIITIQSALTPITPTEIFVSIFRSTGDALFIAFVVYWVVVLSQSVLIYLKKLEKQSDEPITMNKFIIGSIVSGFLYGLMMMIQTEKLS